MLYAARITSCVSVSQGHGIRLADTLSASEIRGHRCAVDNFQSRECGLAAMDDMANSVKEVHGKKASGLEVAVSINCSIRI
jgi:hypothetical protein